MPRRKPVLHLVKSSLVMIGSTRFRTGEEIPESGIYRVVHKAHRLPHQVTLYAGQTFPRCAKCQQNVRFELLHAAPAINESNHGFRVHLYELPVINDAEEAEAV